MSETTHVHQVLFWLKDQKTPIPRGQFVKDLNEEFGTESSFSSCSEFNLKGEDVLNFLLNRNKLVDREGLIDLHPNLKICDGHLR